MKYALFLGCAIPIKYPGFEAATRLVCERLDIELLDLPFSCCPPPTSLKLVHYDSWLALAARNLCLAEEAKVDLLTLCSGCVNTLKEANLVLKRSDSRRRKVNKILEEHNHQFKGSIEVTHILDVLYRDTVAGKIFKEKVLEHPEINIDDYAIFSNGFESGDFTSWSRRTCLSLPIGAARSERYRQSRSLFRIPNK